MKLTDFDANIKRESVNPYTGGAIVEYGFDNGFGASVLTVAGSRELAVIGRDGKLNYRTAITSDVVRVTDDATLASILALVALLGGVLG